MATHSSILAWKISWTEEPGGLQSMGSQRVGHGWATNTYSGQTDWVGRGSASLSQVGRERPGGSPMCLSLGQKSLVVCSPWGHKESGTTEPLTLT